MGTINHWLWLRGPALAATAVVGLATLLITIDSLNTGEVIAFHPEHQMLPGIKGLLLPIGVWRGRNGSGPASSGRLPWTAAGTHSPKYSPDGCG